MKYLLPLLLILLSAAAMGAEPAAVWSAAEPGNIRLMEGGECKVAHTSVEGRDCVLVEPWGGPMNYMYFALDPETRGRIEPAGSLVIEYCLTDGVFLQLNWEIDSSRGPYDGQGSIRYMGGGWNRAVARYDDFVPVGKMNFGADFRLTTRPGLAVSRVEIYNERIEEESQEDLLDAFFETMDFNNKRSEDAFYVFGVGVYDTIDVNTGKLLKKLGVTSVENYVTWRSVENEGKDRWDWSLWDRNLEIVRESGLKWSPAIMHSPAYTIPDWYAESDEFVPNACLEHGTAGKTISLWSPGFDRWTERFVKAFAERYAGSGMIESLIPGIQGDFGEAIYTVQGNSVIYDLIGGPYHNHIGYWCNDPYALKSFQAFAADKYGDMDKLNKAWHTSFGSREDIRFPFYGEEEIRALMARMPGDPTCRRYYLDFVCWYRGCMTDHADRWLAMLRKYFPDTPIYLCTGGHTDPRLGASFAEECRVAAKNKCGVRITNEDSDYANNFVHTRQVSSAGKYYGAYYGYEPAGAEDEVGIVARIYNSTASGCDHLHDYMGNVTSSDSRMTQQQKHIGYLFRGKAVVPVALWYPNTDSDIRENGAGLFMREAMKIRAFFDYDYLDDSMPQALDCYKVLIITGCSVMETEHAEKIADFARRGGKVLVVNVPGLTSVEGGDELERLLFPESPKGGAFGKGYIYRTDDYASMAGRVHTALVNMGCPAYDMTDDQVYVTMLEGNRFFIYNKEKEQKTVKVEYKGRIHRIDCAPETITDHTLGE
ncbi:MAG: family 14 glycosylhydrolase [Abditibacteriota bacterium]|nr:family 14 glycosylhydrolase [Abditibacteriota bacterium]